MRPILKIHIFSLIRDYIRSKVTKYAANDKCQLSAVDVKLALNLQVFIKNRSMF